MRSASLFFFLFKFRSPLDLHRVPRSDCRGEMTCWNVGRATSIFSYVECAPREVSRLSLFFPFFFPLKIKSHYLSTAVLLYVNNAPPRIFTGLHIRYGERRGHIRKEGLLNTLILHVSTRDLFFPYNLGMSVD